MSEIEVNRETLALTLKTFNVRQQIKWYLIEAGGSNKDGGLDMDSLLTVTNIIADAMEDVILQNKGFTDMESILKHIGGEIEKYTPITMEFVMKNSEQFVMKNNEQVEIEA